MVKTEKQYFLHVAKLLLSDLYLFVLNFNLLLYFRDTQVSSLTLIGQWMDSIWPVTLEIMKCCTVSWCIIALHSYEKTWIDLLKLSLELSDFGTELLKFGIELLNSGIELLKIGIKLLKLWIDLSDFVIELLKFKTELLEVELSC